MVTKTKSNPHANCGPLALRPKSYVVEVVYKDAWPYGGKVMGYLYSTLASAMKHLNYLGKVTANQNGKIPLNGKRKNVLICFAMTEHLASNALAKEYGQALGSPLAKFHKPKNLRDIPVGYLGYESPRKPARMSAKKRTNP